MNNNSEDRGMLKWQPFYSVLSEDEVRDTTCTIDNVSKPDLSEDQIEEIEMLIMDAYNNKKEVTLSIFNQHKIIEVSGIITKLDPLHKSIYLNKQMILFTNILKIQIL